MKQLFLFGFFTLFVWAEHNHTNALIDETSPYLQQHIHNPVNWYPWGNEALIKAKKENKMIFLSIGYSTCHWCHVMEEESFVDTYVAELLNKDFISIKVDKEEYSQIDKKYQTLYKQIRGKRGGWPLSVFMSPTQEVFHITTYIPKENGYGVDGLLDLIPAFVSLKHNNKMFQERIDKYKHKSKIKPLPQDVSSLTLSSVVQKIAKQYDSKNGGFATRPKFPEASKVELLLDIFRLEGNKQALEMAEHTLRSMALGGIYDQIGGGFFRYSIDYAWHTPHFEKMLYTNAELIPVYVQLYAMTSNPLYKKIVDETIEQMEKNFMKEGVYFSATDADSDGEEGAYFIYEYIEVKSDLKYKGWNPKEIEEVLAYIHIEEDGNIDGDFSLPYMSSGKVPEKLEALKSYLKSESAKRSFPFIDKKINTAWNAMMIKALFVASKSDKKYLTLAISRLESLIVKIYKNGILYHQTLLGRVATQQGLLEDYAFLIDALIEGYFRTYDTNYLENIETLTAKAITKFYKNNKWYLSDDGLEILADFDDRHYTSALSKMLDNIARVSTLTHNLNYNDIVKETIAHSGSVLFANPENASKLVHTYLRLEKGDVIIHSKKNKLLNVQSQLDKITYPFTLSAVQESDKYLACTTMMCFAQERNISKLITHIEKAVK